MNSQKIYHLRQLPVVQPPNLIHRRTLLLQSRNTSGSTRTSIIKTSPSLKALESILNEKNKQYNTTNTNIIEEVEEETEETEKSEKQRITPRTSFIITSNFV